MVSIASSPGLKHSYTSEHKTYKHKLDLPRVYYIIILCVAFRAVKTPIRDAERTTHSACSGALCTVQSRRRIW